MSIYTIPATVGLNNIINNVYEKLAVVKPMKAVIGGDGWVFDIPQTEEITYSREVTDHYTESGNYINDHAVYKPIEINLTGMVGTLTDFYRKNNILGKIEGIAGELSNRLTVLGGVLGPLEINMSPQARQDAQKVLRDIEMVANAVGLLDVSRMFSQGDNMQEQYGKLLALYDSNTFLTVSTPWGEFERMAITNLSITSTDQTTESWNISMSLKQVRVVDAEITEYDPAEHNRGNIQNAPKENVGMIEGQKTAQKQLAVLIGDLFKQ